MENNPELELAWNFLEKTDRNIFLTGKAGTGKTTFLHKIRNESFKRLVVVAPTGVAAINARGVTIHSFFQMSFGPILPINSQNNSQEPNNPAQKKFNKRKIDILKSLDLLIIDEISMVRADLLDGIDQVLRKYKNRSKVFGGVQVLMIGDLQQLSPVVKNDEWQLLQSYYDTPYFFSSKAFQASNAVGIELHHIYRQKNEKFINILNEIRNNCITEESLNTLNQQFNPYFKVPKNEGYITLTTHNESANEINQSKLQEIHKKSMFFSANIEGDFPEYMYPTHYELELKVGAQVMFIKNDSSPEKRYFNGKIGTVIELDDEQIVVKCPDDDFEIITEAETWDNVNFTLNEETKEIDEHVKGKFSQIPLKLAWAITIHKSQGLTFEKAIIDVTSSFAHGQTYVALSRCKTLEGIVLRRKIEKSSIIHDNRVLSFTKNIEEHLPDAENLVQSQKQYQLSLINELFSFKELLYTVNKCAKIVTQNAGILTGNIEETLINIRKNGLDELNKVGESFHFQLLKMSNETNIEPEKSDLIQERISKALSYYINQTQEFIEKPFTELTYSTDNKAVEKEIKEQIEKISDLLSAKMYCFTGLKDDDFNTIKYLDLRAKSVLQKVKLVKPKAEYISTEHNPILFAKLRQLRHELASEKELNHYQIFTQKSLYEICEKLPTTTKQLSLINGMGKTRVKKYGKAILEAIKEYCQERDIEIQEEIPEVKIKKVDTKLVSYQMLREGMTISEIAKARNFAISTIEGHLSHFILKGELAVEEVLPKEKCDELKELILNSRFGGLSELKSKLGDKYTYGELRLVLNDLQVNEK